MPTTPLNLFREAADVKMSVRKTGTQLNWIHTRSSREHALNSRKDVHELRFQNRAVTDNPIFQSHGEEGIVDLLSRFLRGLLGSSRQLVFVVVIDRFRNDTRFQQAIPVPPLAGRVPIPFLIGVGAVGNFHDATVCINMTPSEFARLSKSGLFLAETIVYFNCSISSLDRPVILEMTSLSNPPFFIFRAIPTFSSALPSSLPSSFPSILAVSRTA